MVNPIKSIHPYKVKGIKCVEDYFFILKRLSKLIEEKKFRLDPDGILVLVRWSNKKKCWVGDKCTSLYRDKVGISINDLQFLNSLNNDYKLALRCILEILSNNGKNIEQYNLHKNENKALAFKIKIKDYITKENCINLIGLFSINRSKHCEILDISNETILKISGCLNLDSSHITHDLKTEKNLFDEFIKSIRNKILTLNIDNKNKEFYIKNIICNNQKIFENKISFENKKYDNFNSSLFNEIIFNKKLLDNSISESIIPNLSIYYLDVLYFEFIKRTIFLDVLNEPINIYDKINKKLYKISASNYINKETETNHEKKDVFDLNYKLMLPGLI